MYWSVHKVGEMSTRIGDMDALSLSFWRGLSKFVMEVSEKEWRTLCLNARQPGKVLNGLNARQSEIFTELLSNFLMVFDVSLEM